MPFPFSVKNRLQPCHLAWLGLFLLIAAPRLPGGHATIQYAYVVTGVVAWTAAIEYGALRLLATLPIGQAQRCLLVAMLFAVALLPPELAAARRYAVQSLSMLGLVLLTRGLIGWPRLHPFCAKLGEWLQRAPAVPSGRFVGAACAAFLLTAVTLSWYCYSFLPAIDDSLGQYIQGKFFASGKVYESHPLQESFAVNLMFNSREKWYSIWQPLHAFMLGLGHKAGMPWAVNPLEGALTLLVIYALARRSCDLPTARLAAILTLLCPFMFFMSSEYMNHATSLLFSALFMWCYVETLAALDEQRKYRLWAFAAGLALGMIFLVRPLTCVGVGLSYAVYSLILLRQQPRFYWQPFALMAAGAALCIPIQGWYDLQTTGEFWLLPYAKHNSVGIPGFGRENTLLRALFKAQEEWSNLNIRLFEWFVPGTLFIALACLSPLANRNQRLLLAMIATFTLVNLANRYPSHTFGPRFMYETSPALIILTAAGIMRLPSLLRAWPGPVPDKAVLQGITAILLMVIFTTGWASRLPPRIQRFAHPHIVNHPGFYKDLLAKSEKPALIFIGHVGDGLNWEYHWVAFTNPPDERAPVIFAKDLGEEKNRKLIDYYPRRKAYLKIGDELQPIENTPAP